jgi:hypothetical protein
VSRQQNEILISCKLTDLSREVGKVYYYLLDREDIVMWRRKYLRQIKELRKQKKKNILFRRNMGQLGSCQI